MWIDLFLFRPYVSTSSFVLRCRKPFDVLLMFKILILKNLHNLSDEETEQIKKGEIPESLSSNPHVLLQKDTDARWTKKNNISSFGYKDHVLADEEYKFIREYAVTDASVHDSVAYLSVLPARAAFWIGLRNLVYNMGRFVGLRCPKPVWVH